MTINNEARWCDYNWCYIIHLTPVAAATMRGLTTEQVIHTISTYPHIYNIYGSVWTWNTNCVSEGGAGRGTGACILTMYQLVTHWPWPPPDTTSRDTPHIVIATRFTLWGRWAQIYDVCFSADASYVDIISTSLHVLKSCYLLRSSNI